MNDTKYLLIYAIGTGFGGVLLRIAAASPSSQWDEEEMRYYVENGNLRIFLKPPDHVKVVRVEEIDNVIA